MERGISRAFGVPGYVAQFGWVIAALSVLGLALLLVGVALMVTELLRPTTEEAYSSITT